MIFRMHNIIVYVNIGTMFLSVELNLTLVLLKEEKQTSLGNDFFEMGVFEYSCTVQLYNIFKQSSQVEHFFPSLLILTLNTTFM